MPVMGFVKFERFFRAAGSVNVNRDDIKRYLDFVNDAIYDLLLMGQATAKANARDIIEPWDTPDHQGTAGKHPRVREHRRGDRAQAHPRPAGRPPPLDAALSEDTQARLPLIFGGISVALARTFQLVNAELKAVHNREWERAFSIFRLLI